MASRFGLWFSFYILKKKLYSQGNESILHTSEQYCFTIDREIIMCYKNQNEVDQIAMDAWMDEMDAAYMEEAYMEEKAAEEAERNFEYFGEC